MSIGVWVGLIALMGVDAGVLPRQRGKVELDSGVLDHGRGGRSIRSNGGQPMFLSLRRSAPVGCVGGEVWMKTQRGGLRKVTYAAFVRINVPYAEEASHR